MTLAEEFAEELKKARQKDGGVPNGPHSMALEEEWIKAGKLTGIESKRKPN